ncbi:DinB family protein [Dongia rigui]|uniref:DinB family protein n=1 Tax=Dongia rigui TaxID=940149 RepID=A0ABU5E4K5_9PROT|nr:DinB family protein [Dongia rigui]MDY0874292.1 DinB family protein [Dongia rigui]
MEEGMATGAALYFLAMARNNAWANHRLLQACKGLSAAEFTAERTSFFPSIVATYNHILVVDWFYVDALEGGTLGPKAWENEIPFPNFGDFDAAQRGVDRRLIALCSGLDDEKLAAEIRMHRASHVQFDRADRVLLHLFEHQIHHRGQIHAMLAGSPVKPPQLDEFFCAGDAKFRADDMVALGWTEEDVWRGLDGR